MDFSVCLLWTISSFMVFLPVMIMTHITLTPKCSAGATFLCWLLISAVDLGFVLACYMSDIFNDTPALLGQPVLLCLAAFLLYKETVLSKLFFVLTMFLLYSASTFMFCGTADTFLGAAFGFFNSEYGPYTVENIVLFMIIKFGVYMTIFILYLAFLKERTLRVIMGAKKQMKSYVAVSIVSLVSFNIICYVTNVTGIVPTSIYFFLLYVPICAVYLVNYYQIYTSVYWATEASEANKLVRLDSLTGLGNKMAYFETENAMDREIHEGKAAFSIIMLDLNDLKVVNDKYGHDKGDEMIKLLADAMRNAFSIKGCTLCRIGGDEFSVVLHGDALRQKDTLLRAFDEAVKATERNEPWARLSVAVGSAEYDGSPGQTFLLVYQKADAAMYNNKAKMKASRRNLSPGSM